MSIDPILLLGGSGAVGRWSARHLREAHPDVPLLVGGRDGARAAGFAAKIGHAEGVAIDLAAPDLGLGARPIGAVAVMFPDEALAGLRFAQARGVPHISVASSLDAIASEVAIQTHRRENAAVVLGTEWLVGATTIPTLRFAQAFQRLDTIRIGAVFDDEDLGGKAHLADVKALKEAPPPALTFRGGVPFWRAGEDARSVVHTADGTPLEAFPLSVNDVPALAAATGAPDIAFDLAFGTSSARRRGDAPSTEIVIELSGEGRDGRPLRTRHAVVHPEGQFPVTGLGVALVLERLVGLDGEPAASPGVYFPYQLVAPTTFFRRFAAIGGDILDLEPL